MATGLVTINVSGGDTTLIDAPPANAFIRILHYHFSSDRPVSVSLKSGSNTIDQSYATLASGGCITTDYAIGGVAACNPGESLVIGLSTPANVGGVVTYVVKAGGPVPPPPPPPPTPPLLVGLAAAYRFDNSLVDSEDSKPLTNTSGGNLAYTTGVLGQAITGSIGGNATANRIQDLLSGSIANGDWSVCGWFKCDISGTAYIELNNVSDVSQVAVGIQDTGPSIKGYTSILGAVGDPFRASPVSPDTWQFVAFTATGGNGRLYVDGALVGSPHALVGAGTFDSTGTAEVNAAGGASSGSADMILVYSRTLSASEISQLYNGGVGFDPTA